MTEPVTTAWGQGRARVGKRRPSGSGWFAHSSGRFDRSLYQLLRSLMRLRRLCVLVTGTEVGGRPSADMRRALLRDGWAFAHLTGGAPGECYATWDTDSLTLQGRPWARKLSSKTYTRSPEYGGKPAAFVHALVVKLQPAKGNKRPVFVVVVHMPTDSTDLRQEVWLDCCRGLRMLESDLRNLDPNADVVIHADWNKDYHRALERQLLNSQVAKPLGLVQTWTANPLASGTHGDELIDGAMVPAGLFGGRCELLPDDSSSDHRPFRYRIRFRKAVTLRDQAKALVHR